MKMHMQMFQLEVYEEQEGVRIQQGENIVLLSPEQAPILLDWLTEILSRDGDPDA